MLKELLWAAARKDTGESRPRGISMSGLFPCPHRLYRLHIGESYYEEPDARQIYNMSDGWFQEEETIVRLKRAKVEITNRQQHVVVGRSGVPGHIDGMFTIQGEPYLFEHKAWGDIYFQTFVSMGIEVFPGAEAQVNGYLKGLDIKKADFIVKNKNTNDYHDIIYTRKDTFIDEIIEWCDKIRLEGWKPEPKLCKYCAHCGYDCFGTVLDFSRIGSLDTTQMAEQYKKGYMMAKGGEYLMDEAKAYFVGKTDKQGNILVPSKLDGEKSVWLVDGLRIRRLEVHRFDISKQKVLDFFGPEGLVKVGEEKTITQYRFEVLDK